MARELFMMRASNLSLSELDHARYTMLVAIDEAGQAVIKASPDGQPMKIKITDPRARNLRQHNYLFALLATAAEMSPRPVTTDSLLFALKVLLGHADWVYVGGQMHPNPKSIAFHNLEQAEFNKFFDEAIRIMLKDYMPANTDGDLFRKEIEERALSYFGGRGE